MCTLCESGPVQGPPAMMMAKMDRCHLVMQRLGWRVGESATRDRDGAVVWHVEATRHGHTILIWASSQTAAWEKVCRLAQQKNLEDSRHVAPRLAPASSED